MCVLKQQVSQTLQISQEEVNSTISSVKTRIIQHQAINVITNFYTEKGHKESICVKSDTETGKVH